MSQVILTKWSETKTRTCSTVQVEKAFHQPLPIRTTPAKITENVFAMGTPKIEKFRRNGVKKTVN
ncbi:MAG: hypothetical protein CBD27_07115 [Rhodospirillaceae bacterium TMED167]|nr:hypothetical protein [Rhodospirillaceae bacterium]OUW27093.1 MAG: hypothetical protein CBD27_07115 [Rhodospirillaceae bacterium TMED167]